jgi:hypothetical protein
MNLVCYLNRLCAYVGLHCPFKTGGGLMRQCFELCKQIDVQSRAGLSPISMLTPYVGCMGTPSFGALAAQDLLSNHYAVDLSTLDLLTALVFEPLQAPYTYINHKAASSKLVNRLAVVAAWPTTT